MKIILTNKKDVVDIVRRMVFLAYNACGGASGMGIFQEMRLGGQKAEEDQVWQCAYRREDYPGGRRDTDTNEIYCDYVFGRMMKWGCRWDDKSITLSNGQYRSDYQGFSGTYPDDQSLAKAAIQSLGVTSFEWQSLEEKQ